MSRDRYDAIVVGAGPGGSATATLLARRGRRALLLDRASFPRRKLCTHAIMPAGLPVLAELGVLDAIEAAGAQRWYGARLWLNGTAFSEPLPRRRVAYPYGLSLRRQALDAILLDAARGQPGVQVNTSTAVTELLRDGRRICGVRAEIEGSEREFEAPMVVLAGGRHTRLTRGAGLRTYAWPNRHTAYIAYIAGMPHEEQPGLEGYYWQGRSASLLPADGGLRVGGVMAPAGSWRPEELERRFLEELRRYPPLRERLEHARLVARPTPVRGLRSVWRDPVAGGLLLVGDAGLQTDPLFGQGISWALRGAAWAAEAIDVSLNSADPGVALRRYARRRARIFGHRFAAMSAFSLIEPGSMIERLVVANATVNPASTSLFLRLILGFATVSRADGPRRSLATWVREAACRTRSRAVTLRQ